MGKTGKRIPGRRNSKSKSLETEKGPTHLRKRKEARELEQRE